jgi:hypothetical protein
VQSSPAPTSTSGPIPPPRVSRLEQGMSRALVAIETHGVRFVSDRRDRAQ